MCCYHSLLSCGGCVTRCCWIMCLWLGRVLNDCQLKEHRFTNSTAEPKELHSAAKSQSPFCYPQQTQRGHMKTTKVSTWTALSWHPLALRFFLTLQKRTLMHFAWKYLITSWPGMCVSLQNCVSQSQFNIFSLDSWPLLLPNVKEALTEQFWWKVPEITNLYVVIVVTGLFALKISLELAQMYNVAAFGQ